ncbi:MAG: diguanylate cyclase with and sensor [Massilia sp.]|jgi:diguanylate cyclase (GGDEF)-like protein/PAS domain S-box-containing protein|nr:diguanylate cyclase with and sensor [Massilia sp.]MDB5951171.1 diguanylate cyclase with and sensor [Massilia sp.]
MKLSYTYCHMEPAPYTPSANFLDLLVDAVCAVDADGRFVFVSNACERIFGYTPEEMVGTSMIDMVAPEDRARTLAAAGDVMAGAAEHNFENRYLRKDGQLVHIMWSARWSEADQLRIAVARDVTGRKRGEAMRAAMYAISEAAHAASDLLTLFPLIHRIVNELLPAPGFSIALHDDAPGQLSFPYNIDEHGRPAVASLPAAGTLCAHVILSGRPLLITPATLAALPAGLRAAADSAAPSWLGVPLTSHGGAVGALVVKGSPESARYTEQDRELLQFVSHQVATAIERVRLHEQLQYLARYDVLTRLPNRQLFHDRLDSALARAVRNPGVFALLYLDLDKFKQVNDLHGHAAGDLLLHEVARRLSGCVREADTAARIGGDEFAVLLEGLQSPEDAARVAAKIYDALSLPVNVGNLTLRTIPSIGIAMYPQHGTSAQQLLKYADDAMYQAKQRRAETDRHCAGGPIAG